LLLVGFNGFLKIFYLSVHMLEGLALRAAGIQGAFGTAGRQKA